MRPSIDTKPSQKSHVFASRMIKKEGKKKKNIFVLFSFGFPWPAPPCLLFATFFISSSFSTSILPRKKRIICHFSYLRVCITEVEPKLTFSLTHSLELYHYVAKGETHQGGNSLNRLPRTVLMNNNEQACNCHNNSHRVQIIHRLLLQLVLRLF